MENGFKMNSKTLKEDNTSKIISPEKKLHNKESLTTSLNVSKEYEAHILLNKVIDYMKNNDERNLIFECPHGCCPFIPSLKYYEFTQSVATKCRLGHIFHLYDPDQRRHISVVS